MVEDMSFSHSGVLNWRRTVNKTLPMEIVAACMHLFNICCSGNPVLQPSDLCIVYPVYVLNSVWDYEISLSL